MKRLRVTSEEPWELYRRVRDWKPANAFQNAQVVDKDRHLGLKAVLPVRMSPNALAWADFLKLRIGATNPHYKNRWISRSTSLHPGLVPVRGSFGVIRSEETWRPDDEPLTRLGLRTYMAAFLVDEHLQTCVGFVSFTIDLEVQGSIHSLESELVIHAVWIDPMFRGEGLSSLLVTAVVHGATRFLEAIPPSPGHAGIGITVAGDAESTAGAKFISDCASEMEFEWLDEGMYPGRWIVTSVESELR